MSPKALDRDVPPLKRNPGFPSDSRWVERVEQETDPEVLLHIARQRVEAQQMTREWVGKRKRK